MIELKINSYHYITSKFALIRLDLRCGFVISNTHCFKAIPKLRLCSSNNKSIKRSVKLYFSFERANIFILHDVFIKYNCRVK